jgi:hypothetical protein
LEELSKGFFDHSGGILDEFVCALDGLLRGHVDHLEMK